MKSVIFIVLASFGVIAVVGGSAVDTTSKPNFSSVLKSLNSISNADGAITSDFFTNCPDAQLHLELCISSSNPGNDPCAVLHNMVDCTERAIQAFASACSGAQEALVEVERLRASLIGQCGPNGTASVVAGFLPVIVMIIFSFLRWV